MGNTTVPVLLIVTVFAALVTLRGTSPKASAIGDTLSVDLTPVPDSDTVLVPAPPPAVTWRLAVFAPALVGLNLTHIVQRLPAGTDEPQLLVCVN
jgi:hypothetical protein